jgi:hypothetical protein
MKLALAWLAVMAVLSFGVASSAEAQTRVATPPSTVRVHMNGPANLALEALSPERGIWNLVCRAPCDLTLPLEPLYRVTGPSIEGSKAFHLDASPGGYAVLDVNPTSNRAHKEGLAVAISGGVVLGAGVVSVIVYAAIGLGDSLCTSLDQPNSLGGCADPNQSPPRALLIGGIVAAVVGGAVLIGGLSMAQPTKIDQTKPARDEPEDDTRRRERRWARLPSWRDPCPETLVLPRVNDVPLFRASF